VTRPPGEWIEVVSARTHNLRDLSVRIPKNALVAFTGVSGSGKSSLAIDTIHALSQRWYLEGLSPFVRKFLVPEDRPDVERITGMGASIAVDQQGGNRNPSSTVGSVVGARHPLRLLFSRVLAFQSGVDARFRQLESTAFDARHPDGQCAVCLGVGGDLRVDEALVVAHPERSLLDGASAYAGKLRKRTGSTLDLASIPALAEHFSVDLAAPWAQLSEGFRRAFLHGTAEEIHARIPGGGRDKNWSISRSAPFAGAVHEIERLHRGARTEKAKKKWRVFFSKTPCEACDGTGVGEAARVLALHGLTYHRAAHADIERLAEWSRGLSGTLSPLQREIAVPLMQELTARIGSLSRLGLGHLSLSRPVPTLSGGELQRVRLGSQLGSGLTGIVYVLDEPSSGLHPRDRGELLKVLIELRDRGNTVLMVEHDMDIVARCDWVIDIGPRAGVHGGTLLASGPPAAVAIDPRSVTGPFLSPDRARERNRARRRLPASTEWLRLRGLTRHNVAGAAVDIPLGRYTCITGVSGAGKSTLLAAVALAADAELRDQPHGVAISGCEQLAWMQQVTQAPIGRTGRSNPATYTKLFDQVRRLYAETPAAVAAGLDESAFSFNTGSGRCPACEGTGTLVVDMHYLPAISTTCPGCHGQRFQRHILDVTIHGLSIADVLRLTVDEARRGDVLAHQGAQRTLGCLVDVGLEYMTLGQPAPTLSGGESQRLKLARLLARTPRKGRGLIILDEPTAGLHPLDTARIIRVLEKLTAAGHTVLAADHQLAAQAEADWLITVGPGAGPGGGQVLSQRSSEPAGADP